MENHLVYRTLVDYYRGEDEDWFNELGFHTNPMKAYLYTVAILHDTVLLLGTQQHLLRDGNEQDLVLQCTCGVSTGKPG